MPIRPFALEESSEAVDLDMPVAERLSDVVKQATDPLLQRRQIYAQPLDDLTLIWSEFRLRPLHC